MLLKTLLKSYLRKLTNLTASNRSLVVLKLYEESDIDLCALEHAESNRGAFQILEEIIKAKKQIHLCDYIDSRDSEINLLSKKLSKIHNKCKLIEEERGAKDLYVGYPFVTGKLNDGSIVRCPLIFFPVELQLIKSTKGGNSWILSPLANELPFINRSFLLAYSHFNQVALNEELLDFTFEDEYSDSLAFRNSLYEMLKTSVLTLNFNSEIFQNTLKPIRKFSKSEYESQFENGLLKLEPQCVLGVFPQSGSYLAPDYSAWLELANEETVEDFYFDKNIDAKAVKEENILTAFPIDASQEQAIVAIKSGKSIVVQGPPGTGKSQLISNLATDFAANGKKVLVVCQKRAALDVVHQRLSTIGFGDFVALVHDFKADRKKLYDQLNKQIERIDDYKVQNSTLNSIVIEREFLQTSRGITENVAKLDSFKNALYDTQTFGISPKELYLKSDPNRPFIDYIDKVSKFNYHDFEGLMQKFSSLFDYASIFENDAFVWKNRISFATHSLADFKSIQSQIIEIQRFTSEANFTYHQIIQFYELKNEWHYWKSTLKNVVGSEILVNSKLGKQKFNFPKAFAKLDELERLKSTVFLIYENNELALDYLAKVELAISKYANFATKLWWKLTNKNSKIVSKLLIENALTDSIANLEILKSRIESTIAFTNTADALLNIVKLDSKLKFELHRNADLISIIRNSLFALESTNTYEVFKALISYESNKWLLYFENLIVQSQALNLYIPLWKKYFKETQLILLFESERLPKQLSESLNSHFEKIVAYDQLLAELSASEADFYFSCIHFIKNGVTSKADFLFLAQNSLYISWLNILEQNETILKATETLQLAQLEENLQTLVVKKQKLAIDIIQLKLKERTYQNNVFNRLNNRLTYRELQHQLTKKKKIWKLRKLIENFNAEIFDLTPIWLVSPETVSAIFPLEPLFDLIIFDEASQCFAEKGFPAMYRGKQIVVAGDSKQLQPNDLYQPRYESAQETDTDSAIDSLLSISEKYALQTTLTGHYRSLLPELIAFSNANFYENRLQILPEYELMHNAIPPIHYIKTEGIWSDNCNVMEAEKVLDLTLELLKTKKGKQIGIITFNARQQDLIENLFESYAIANNFNFPDWLFIKNIENVQGDERGIILFSIAYAPDKLGKMQMQFGSLNQLHGENRLNVAITRAKEEIYIVTSIFPEQLLVETATNEGPKLLKNYLKFAQSVSCGDFKPRNTNSNSFTTDWFLKHKLVETLPNTRIFNLPFADVAQYSNDNQQIQDLILTDDEYFHHSISSKDFFAYHPLALKNKNWSFSRYFSRTFWKSTNY